MLVLMVMITLMDHFLIPISWNWQAACNKCWNGWKIYKVRNFFFVGKESNVANVRLTVKWWNCLGKRNIEPPAELTHQTAQTSPNRQQTHNAPSKPRSTFIALTQHIFNIQQWLQPSEKTKINTLYYIPNREFYSVNVKPHHSKAPDALASVYLCI